MIGKCPDVWQNHVSVTSPSSRSQLRFSNSLSRHQCSASNYGLDVLRQPYPSPYSRWSTSFGCTKGILFPCRKDLVKSAGILGGRAGECHVRSPDRCPLLLALQGTGHVHDNPWPIPGAIPELLGRAGRRKICRCQQQGSRWSLTCQCGRVVLRRTVRRYESILADVFAQSNILFEFYMGSVQFAGDKCRCRLQLAGRKEAVVMARIS